MKQFFKFLFASCLGVFLALVVIGIIFAGMAGSLGRKLSSAEKPEIKPNSVLVIKLDNDVPELTNNVEGKGFSLKQEKNYGLNEIIDGIKNAATDKNIKGIYLALEGSSLGQASTYRLRQELDNFKKSGKFIYAYAPQYSQKDYYLSTVADKIYLHPMGMVDFKGYGVMLMYFKDLLDELGIKMQVYYAGQFKSATEPFRLNKMSEQNKLQMREYITGLYDLFLADVSKSRNIPVAKLQEIANNYEGRNPQSALSIGLIDGIKYSDEVSEEIKTKLGLGKDDKIEQIDLDTYLEAVPSKTDFKVNDKIAVIYAEGEIRDEGKENGVITGEKYVGILKKIRKDKNVKAVVLRVNSPGGSAYASDLIWREINLLKAEGIPVVVSMGDYAASGGYYISCNADSIFAEPNTLTGSIGVFGMIPSVKTFMTNKLKITFDSVKTSNYAIGINPFNDLSQNEGALVQQYIDSTYERFLEHVATGRHKTRDAVHEIAQGRIWLGSKAVDLGLVDKIGNLNDAIACAARMAKLDKYRTSNYPVIKDKYMQLIEELTGQGDNDDEIQNTLVKKTLGDYAPYYEQIKQVTAMKGPQARIPYIVEFH